MWIIAHRGASGVEPGNTMAAFEAAAIQGADIIEVDVRLSSDGVPVAYHDAGLEDGGKVAEVSSLPVDHLAAIRSHAPIPTLEAVLMWARGRIGVYLDLKVDEAVDPLARLVEDLAMGDEVVAGCSTAESVRRWQQVAPAVPTSLLVRPPDPDAALRLGVELGVRYLHPCWEHAHPRPHLLLDDGFLAATRSAGIGMVTWQEDRPDELRQLLALGVDGICTNHPDRLVALRAAQD